ncbi:CDP-diacylglycerol--serine O-phosphatidyltransferase [Desulfolucanica intricata]|uniref:CDP-diacylglycerol--serine O-phosphatidyltransferase n=1 Tax=Desulfolucanica intricata TaxID=1285191 RepID=UPI0008360294|nr:CDP-diacylglycerol--serine O-phosphatidyltransferase [Desulfolucanica intricata]
MRKNENSFPVAVLPNILTFCNIIMGLMAIIVAAADQFTLAGLLIILGAVFDRFDGKVARKFHVTSEMGKQLDSLADVITFGIAPAITIFMLSFTELQFLGLILAITFVICGAYRLARYNILNYDNVFVGLPITVAGFLLALFALYQTKFDVHPYITAIGMLLLSYFMVCKHHIKKV